MSKYTVIIGAGVGGLSAAIHLAAAGQRVVVLEKNAAVGGKTGEMRYPAQDAFAALERRVRRGASPGTPARR